MPWHPYTREIISAYADSIEFSLPISATARPGTPGGTDTRSAQLVALKRSALDLELKRIEQGLRWEGVSLSLEFHALRRTGARMFLAAAAQIGKGPLESLLELRGLLGHASVTTTMKYVGWEIENAGATMAAMPRLENRTATAEAPAPEGGMDRVGFMPTTARTPRRTPPTS